MTLKYLAGKKKSKFKLLVLDKDLKLFELIKSFPESEKRLEIDSVTETEKALGLIKTNNYDCIISGSELNYSNSLDFLKEIRENHNIIPFILVIESGNQENIEECISEGLNDYFVKKELEKNPSIFFNRLNNVVRSAKAEFAAETFMSRVSDAFFSLDMEGRFTFINQKAIQMVDPDTEQLLGKNIWESFPEIKDTKFQQKIEESMQTQETIQFEEYFSPHRTWFSVRVYPSSTGVSVYFQDINQRKSWEEQIKNQVGQQTAMKEILRMALEGIESTELQHEMAKLSANAVDVSYCQISKYDRDSDQMVLSASYGFENSEIGEPIESEGENGQVRESFMERDLVAVDDYLKSTEFERTREQEYLGIRSGITAFIGEYDSPWGVISFYSQKVRKFTDSEKEFVQSLASALGTVIENQNQRIKLQEYKKAIDSLDKGVYLLDNQSRFLFVNSAFEDLTGYRNESLEGKKTDFIGAEDISKGQTSVRTFDGNQIEVETSFSAVELPDGTRGKVAVVQQSDPG